MGPTCSIYNNSTATYTGGIFYQGNTTFYPTCNNDIADSAEAEEQRLAEIGRLKAMLRMSELQEENRYIKQQVDLQAAKIAPIKHKKPHMNRRIII